MTGGLITIDIFATAILNFFEAVIDFFKIDIEIYKLINSFIIIVLITLILLLNAAVLRLIVREWVRLNHCTSWAKKTTIIEHGSITPNTTYKAQPTTTCQRPPSNINIIFEKIGRKNVALFEELVLLSG
jgi:hypothetical protein